jgi:neutral trehalase
MVFAATHALQNVVESASHATHRAALRLTGTLPMQPYIHRFFRTLCSAVVAVQLALLAATATARDVVPLQPSQVYGELFERVQSERLFPDSKTFADATAKSTPEQILQNYESQKRQAGFELKKFVEANFVIPSGAGSGFKTARRSVHISNGCGSS